MNYAERTLANLERTLASWPPCARCACPGAEHRLQDDGIPCSNGDWRHCLGYKHQRAT